MTPPTERSKSEPPPRVAAAALALTHDALVATDDAATILWHDARFAGLAGLADDAGWMGRSLLDALRHPDTDPRAEREVTDALAERHDAGPIEITHRRADGSAWQSRLTVRVLDTDAPRFLVALSVVAVDVAELRASLRRAADVAHRLEAAADVAGIGLCSWKLGSDQTSWNTQMWALFGLAPEGEIPAFADWVRRVVHPADRDRLLAEPRRWYDARPSHIDIEFRIVRPDGAVRWVVGRARIEESAEARTLYGVLWDVTDRHAAQDALRDAYERAALTARGAGIGTWERDLVRGIVRWDEQMYRLRGLEPAQFDAPHSDRIASIHPDDRPMVDACHERAKAGGGEPVAYEYRLFWPDGSQRWIAARAVGVHDEGGGLQRLIGVNWDITAEKTAQVERAEKEAALRESRAKSEFLARMSHELRTPLNAVLGFTQLLQAEEDGTSPLRAEKLQHIRTAGEHLLVLINEVLDLSSLESGQLRLALDATPVADVAREALAMVERLAAARGIALEARSLQGVALADRTRLRQVLINLLSNAVKFNRPRGRVTLRCETRGTRIAVRISDTGRGMTREQLAHLFEPFNRLGAERDGIDGTGIGLVIVKVIVERMGGTVHVASRPGAGTVVEVRLRTPDSSTDPMALSATMPLAATPPPQPTLRAARLLYIEDNPVNTLLVQELIAQRPGLELLCESDGRAGIERARTLQPDLVLVDMQLPDMDGHEVLRRLRADASTAALPCIALSANALRADIERALAAGFADYWTKPIDLSAFLASLDALFGRAQG